MRIASPLLLLTLVTTACSERPSANTLVQDACRIDGSIAPLPPLPEASGLTASARVPDRFWTHNDSGQPILFNIDKAGAVRGRVELSGIRVTDWEAVASGPCPSGSCLYVADIGDNNANRDHITLYRLPEPGDAEAKAAVVEAFNATYPDGAHDAETLLVSPDGGVYVVTKGSTGPVALYKFPPQLPANGTAARLERVGEPHTRGKIAKDEQITDGAVSSDGTRVVLRTHDTLFFFRTQQLLAGDWTVAHTSDVTPIGEAQGEGVAFGADNDNALYLIGEGGGRSRPGTFARLHCTG
jgi:hypothetical protein